MAGPTSPNVTRHKWLWFLPTAGVLVAIAFLVLAPSGGPRRPGPVTIEMGHAREVAFALHYYAEDHEGRFPPALSDLPQDDLRPQARHFHDPVTKQEEDWLYNPGYKKDDPPTAIILASPHIVAGHKRIVVFCDLSMHIIEEAAYARQVSEQLKTK